MIASAQAATNLTFLKKILWHHSETSKCANSEELLQLTRSCWSEFEQKSAALKKAKAGKPVTGCRNAAPDTPSPKPTACFENAISFFYVDITSSKTSRQEAVKMQ